MLLMMLKSTIVIFQILENFDNARSQLDIASNQSDITDSDEEVELGRGMRRKIPIKDLSRMTIK